MQGQEGGTGVKRNFLNVVNTDGKGGVQGIAWASDARRSVALRL